ncbi:toxin-antitoxin system YwqK family antitoxin [Flavobacterium sp. GSA192]|uniref:toxin-antitoxin system YwqK family antitoxin n=1 Tax=Flavobacterium sp. GSA192 TaxID=2576304 RepID=UPI00112DD68C|nr:toxin-antitoxin system YwqK family antitoxin [Flavobacterium sp. GSA192]
MKHFFLIVLIGFISKSYSQNGFSDIYNNDSIIKKGVNLYDLEKFDEAIAEYNKISPNDPKYLSAQYEKALCLNALNKKDELKLFLENLYLTKQMQKSPELYTLYAVFLSDNKEYELSEKIFTEGKQYLSNSASFLYNFAILYIRKEEHQKCIDLLKQVIIINPNYASAHYLLGLIAFENGKITEGTLALMSYLILAPDGKFAEKAIIQLNAKFGENYLTKNNFIFSKTGDNFEEIETILRNQLPLNKAYKIKSEIDDVIIRQVQAVAEYTLEHKMGDGFFETTYIPWIKEMVEKNYFEGFSYYMLLSYKDKLEKELNKQKKKITYFEDNFYSKDFWYFFAKRNKDLFGKQEEVITFLKDNEPYLVGKVIDGKYEGKYKYLNKNGMLIGELNFVNNELDGLQKYYDDEGKITEEKTFKNGKLNGTRTTYYQNGGVSVIENYQDGILEGISTSFYPNGGKKCEVNFTNGERNGKYECLFENGKQKSEISYLNGKLNGSFKTYNELGNLTAIENYENDILDGEYFEYYNDKTIKSEATYNKGKVKNSYKTYYANSLLEREFNYNDGKLTSLTNYYSNGKKSSEAFYNDKEQLENYNYYDIEGNLYFIEKYKSGEINSGIQYSLKNQKPIEINLLKNKFDMNDYNGTTIVSGNYSNGKKNDLWLYYYPSGAKRLEENYTANLLNGISKTLNKNGSLNTVKNFINDKINGKYEVYENGKLASTYNYTDDIKSGPYQTFYPDGTLNNEGYFIDENLNYDYKSYWQNGNIYKQSTYIDGAATNTKTYNEKGEIENEFDYKNKTGIFDINLFQGTITRSSQLVNGINNGTYTEKDKLGNTIVEAKYINGLLHDNYKYYGPLGTLKFESNYYLGYTNGTSKNYDLCGNLRVEYTTTHGVQNGKTTHYYHNKSKLSEYNEINDSQEGEHLYYNQKGELILTIGYQNNSPVYYIARSKNNEPLSKTIINKENANIISYYSNGKIAMQINLVNGETDGKLVIKNVEGKTEYECNYTNGLLNGERIEYYSNGTIYKKEHFINNNYDGLQEFFNEDTKPKISAEYKNDQLNGKTLIYTNGKLKTTKKYNSNELVEISI